MPLNKNRDLGNKPIIVIIGLIASCIGIFAFITGRQSLLDLFESPTPIINTSSPQNKSNTPFLSDTPEITVIPSETLKSTSVPSTPLPKTIKIDNPAVSITMQDSEISDGNGIAHFEFYAANTPLRDISILFATAVFDISGNWSTGKYQAGGYIYKTDSNGVINISLEPGDYAAINRDFGAVWNKLMGIWGIEAFDSYGKPTEIIVFPIEEGKTTNVTINLSILEIGLISSDGLAFKNKVINLYCQGQDIAGNIIPSDRCSSSKKTDITGLATFYLGPGTFFIRVNNFPDDDEYFYDITLDVGETRREIYNIP